MPGGQFLPSVFALMAGIASSVRVRSTFPAKADETTVILQSDFAKTYTGLTESEFRGLCFLAWQHDDDGEQNRCGFPDVKD